MARVTLKKLSEHTGLAVSTISEILSGKKNFCSEETCRMVRETAERLGYIPNVGFKIMTGRDSGTAAIIFSQRRTYFIESNLLLSMKLLESLEKQGRSAYTVVMDYTERENLAKIRNLINRGCRDFFFLGSPVGIQNLCRFLKESDLWISCYNSVIDSGLDELPANRNLQVDCIAAYRIFFQHFQKRKMHFFCVMSEHHFNLYCRETLSGLGLEPEKYFLPIEDLAHLQEDCLLRARETARRAAGSVIPRLTAPVGWICMSDHEAVGVQAALLEHHCPTGDADGAFVCGFGNSPAGKVSLCPVNTADLRLDYVVDFMLSGETEKRRILYLPEMIFR